MGIKFEGQVLKFGTVDKCNRKFAPDCKITFPEKIPVAYNFDMDEIIGHADISKVEDGLKGVVSEQAPCNCEKRKRDFQHRYGLTQIYFRHSSSFSF